MNAEQFKRLSDVFWKSATEKALEDTFKGYRDALDDLPPMALDRAVSRALRESKEMPKPYLLREWATAWIPKTTYTKLDTPGPCAHCDAWYAEAANHDGSARRIYLRHRSTCVHPAFAKPASKIWTGWERDPRIATPYAGVKREIKQLHAGVVESIDNTPPTLPIGIA